MVRQRKLSRGVAVVGAGMSRFGMFADLDAKDLFIEAYRAMLASVDKALVRRTSTRCTWAISAMTFSPNNPTGVPFSRMPWD